MLRWSDDAQEQGVNAAVLCLFQSNKPQRSTEPVFALTLTLKTAVEFPSGTTKNAKIRRDEGNGEIDC